MSCCAIFNGKPIADIGSPEKVRALFILRQGAITRNWFSNEQWPLNA